MWIERREHAFHRRGDEVVITRLVPVHVILPNQLDGFGQNRDLRITALVFLVRRPGAVKMNPKKNAGQEENKDRAENQASSHAVNDHLKKHGTIAHPKFLATRKASTKLGGARTTDPTR